MQERIDKIIQNSAHLTHVPQYPTSNHPLPTAGLISEGVNSRIQLAGASQPFVAAKRRPAEPMGVDGDEEGELLRKQAGHQCAKCRKVEGCAGNKGKAKCQNPCRDCGSNECEGRDSRNWKRKCPNS